MMRESSPPAIPLRALKIYIRHFLTFLAISAVSVLPATALAAAYKLQFISVTAGLTQILLAGFTVTAAALVYGLTWVFVYGALTKVATDAYLGEKVQIKAVFKTTAKRYLPLMWTSVLWLLAVGIGFMLFVVPGIYLGVLYSFGGPEVIIEDGSGWSAILHSSALIKGAWWRAAGVISILSLLGLGFYYVLSIPIMIMVAGAATRPAYSASLNISTQVLQSIVSAAVVPLPLIGIVLLYFDQRVRREGFDKLKSITNKSDGFRPREPAH